MQAAKPWNNDCLEVIMDKEDYTNAVWNWILHQWFPAPDYLIVPELLFGGGWADLGVMKIGNPDRLIVVYEGKKSGGSYHTIGHAMNQAVACAKAYKSSPALIAALGTSFVFANTDGKSATCFTADKEGISDIRTVWDDIGPKLVQIKNALGAGGL
ncbi:uncharacterized protein BDZ99DRAFT_501844 [Mytilinidion resinicola]|uniref:Uncharacterized protein n=1 Tax=Mytilinidion resinicola TaxID=574789 RepID=A0A6A6YAQ0_9PEZI|nr:uncharacterized protein BDZ99DRAFT_501844 [Mytilinidion resinicola]KAF2805689.1 hypothetical protein BDZ99DRAFT_501844 [Mytilinidion resinicola]